MNFKDYYINDLSEAHERQREIRTKYKVPSPEKLNKISNQAAAIFRKYEEDLEEKIEREERSKRVATHF